MKYEWRKKEKAHYFPKQTEIIKIKSYYYISLTGEGNPNSDLFSQCIEALYALSYGIKMAPKKGIEIDGYYDFTVFPLEGIWNLNDEGIKKYKEGLPVKELKDFFKFQIMIRQPDFVNNNLFETIKTQTIKKKKSELIKDAVLIKSEEKLVCQSLHLGRYDNEPKTFKMMEEFCQENNYRRLNKSHIEVYLSDARKVIPEKLKTTLRFEVTKK